MVAWKSTLLLITVLLNVVQFSKSCRLESTNSEKPTKLGWILLGDHEYKIYLKKLPWGEAADKCKGIGIKTTLAVLDIKDTAKKFKSYLLSGKHLLESAWIGTIGKGSNSNKHDCPILDQLGPGNILYVTVPCNGTRPYICQRRAPSMKRRNLDVEIEDSVHDMITKHYRYRVFYKPASWDDARKKCESFKKDYGGKMAELRTDEIHEHLKQIMSQNLLPVKHLWLGGSYENNTWWWISDNTKINVNGIKEWLHNGSYDHAAEYLNTCLNMDKDHFSGSIIYGADCSHPQVFVCSFSVEKFEQLKKDEKQEKVKKIRSRRLNQHVEEKRRKNSKKV